MHRSAVRAGSQQGPASIYQDVTDRIVAELEAGRAPWVQPWTASRAPFAMPENAASGRRYSGINILILWAAVIEGGFTAQRWLTFRQALALGGSVRKGERGTTVVYASRFTPGENRQHDRDPGKRGGIPFLKRFSVFNVDQCDGLTGQMASLPSRESVMPHGFEQIVAASGADVRIGGGKAFYSVTHDYVQVPHPDSFFEPVDFARTASHELSHWTGAKSRLGRDQTGAFGTKKYFFEECVAELSAAFVCASLGIAPTVRHADYLGAWLDLVREDNRAIVRAASAASKAAEYLLAFRPEDPLDPDVDADDRETRNGAPAIHRPYFDERRRHSFARHLGAGVQSSTRALMAAQGVVGPMPDCTIFADTGSEPAVVYEHLAWLMSPNVLPFPVHMWSRHGYSRRPHACRGRSPLGLDPGVHTHREGRPLRNRHDPASMHQGLQDPADPAEGTCDGWT